MPPSLFPNFKKPTLAQAVLAGLVVMACTVDFSRQKIPMLGVSGLGVLTFIAGGAVWAAWLLRPVMPAGLLVIFLPLILFGMDAAGTLLWYRPGMDGVQLLVICLTFLGTMMLAAREALQNPAIARQLRKALLVTSVLPVFAWMALILSGIVSGPDTNLSRPFALYTLVIVAVALATWRGYAWPESVPGEYPPRWKWTAFWPLLWIGVIGYVVLLGMSRTALIAIALMAPLSLIYRGNLRGILQGTLMMALGAGVFWVLLFNYQPLHDRFFKEDAHVQVAGMSINATGRPRIWNLLLTTLGDDWIFGKGISASEDIINKTIPNIGQPHNDYLRFYYDQGVVGECLWLSFVGGFVFRTVGNLRRSIRNRSPDYPQHLAALLALTGVAVSMTTDNSYCYAFVMFPLAIVMGTSLGLGRHFADVELAYRPATEPLYFQPILAPAMPRSRSS